MLALALSSPTPGASAPAPSPTSEELGGPHFVAAAIPPALSARVSFPVAPPLRHGSSGALIAPINARAAITGPSASTSVRIGIAPDALNSVSGGSSVQPPAAAARSQKKARTALLIVTTRDAATQRFTAYSLPLHPGDPAAPARAAVYQVPATSNGGSGGTGAILAQPPPPPSVHHALQRSAADSAPATASTVTRTPEIRSTPAPPPSPSVRPAGSAPPKTRRILGENNLPPPPDLETGERLASDCETLGCVGNVCGSLIRPIWGVFRCFTHFLGCLGSGCTFAGCGITSLACRGISCCSSRAEPYGPALGSFACKNFNSIGISLDSVKNRVWDAVTAAWKPIGYVFCCCNKKSECVSAPDDCARRVDILYEKNCRPCCTALPELRKAEKKIYMWWMNSTCMRALNWLTGSNRFWQNIPYVATHRRAESMANLHKALPGLEAALSPPGIDRKLDTSAGRN